MGFYSRQPAISAAYTEQTASLNDCRRLFVEVVGEAHCVEHVRRLAESIGTALTCGLAWATCSTCSWYARGGGINGVSEYAGTAISTRVFNFAVGKAKNENYPKTGCLITDN